MKKLTFESFIKDWFLYPLDKKEQLITTNKLLNQDKSASLNNQAIYSEDWLLFSIKTNLSGVKPLEIRTTPLATGEKIYVVGWTRKMEEGSQRVYEFEYIDAFLVKKRGFFCGNSYFYRVTITTQIIINMIVT